MQQERSAVFNTKTLPIYCSFYKNNNVFIVSILKIIESALIACATRKIAELLPVLYSVRVDWLCALY